MKNYIKGNIAVFIISFVGFYLAMSLSGSDFEVWHILSASAVMALIGFITDLTRS